ncbi:MAG: hypothetical protein ABFD60_03370 [Bryobacteraceae bacterium]
MLNQADRRATGVVVLLLQQALGFTDVQADPIASVFTADRIKARGTA